MHMHSSGSPPRNRKSSPAETWRLAGCGANAKTRVPHPLPFWECERPIMNADEFTLIVFLVSICAGFLGALTGLGGGIVVTPALTLLLGVDMRYAIGASLVSVVATSSGAAAAYVRDGLSNIRIGMFLEMATTLGAVFGAYLGTHINTSWLSVIFGFILL